MLPAALATASRCQPRALRYWRRAAAHRSPGRPGLTRRPSDVQPGNVVPPRSHGADYRSRSISWVFALSKMSKGGQERALPEAAAGATARTDPRILIFYLLHLNSLLTSLHAE